MNFIFLDFRIRKSIRTQYSFVGYSMIIANENYDILKEEQLNSVDFISIYKNLSNNDFAHAYVITKNEDLKYFENETRKLNYNNFFYKTIDYSNFIKKGDKQINHLKQKSARFAYDYLKDEGNRMHKNLEEVIELHRKKEIKRTRHSDNLRKYPKFKKIEK